MRRTPAYIDQLLNRIGRTWASEPDQRFGQFVANIVRRRDDHDRFETAVSRITDDEFLRRLDTYDEEARRRREEFERTYEAQAVRADVPPGVRETQELYREWALPTFGRVGRPPERIPVFLHRFAEAWHECPGRRFGEMVVA